MVQAENYVKKILEKRPKYFPARMLQGELMVVERKFTEAVELFDQLIKEEPRSAAAHYFKGLAHLGKGEPLVSKMSLAKAVELNPGDIRARLLLAEVHMRERSFDLARRECEEVLKLQPDNYQAKHMLGNTHMFAGRAPEAQANYEALIKQDPKNPVGYFRLGLLQRFLKKYDLALANFDKALAINPKLMDVFTNIVIVHAAQKEFDAAIEKCDRQIQRLDNEPAVLAIIYNLKGGLYLAKQEKAMAEEFFNKAITANPDFLQPYYALANIYLTAKNQDKAIAQYESILQKNPRQTNPHMMLGTIYDMQKRYDLAEKHYREALKINPDFVAAANNLAYLLAMQDKNIDEALELARKAKEKLPKDPNIMDTLGLVYYKRGLYDSAAGELMDSLEKLPENAVVHYHLGLVYFKKGEMGKARSELEQALKLDGKFDGSDEARRMLAEMKAKG
jgi:tetratricopeptide (TPR) repeat protein